MFDSISILHYSSAMLLDRQWAVFQRTTWCLFALWILFGGVELAEQAQVISELAGEDQQDSDQDEDALSQLSSGLKSEVADLYVVLFGVADTEIPELVMCFECPSPRRQSHGHSPPSLRLHQSISIYRI